MSTLINSDLKVDLNDAFANSNISSLLNENGRKIGATSTKEQYMLLKIKGKIM